LRSQISIFNGYLPNLELLNFTIRNSVWKHEFLQPGIYYCGKDSYGILLKLLKGFEGESAGLGEKFQRVVVDDLADQRFRVASPAHDGDEFGHGQRIGRILVGGGVY